MVWDPSHVHHKNRNEVNDAWRRIQAEFGENISIPELKKKKESLMSSFRNCLYKVKQSIKSGAVGDELYKPSWFAYNKIAGFFNLRDAARYKMNAENIDSVFVGEDPDSDAEDKSHNDDFVNLLSNPEQTSTALTPRLSLEPSTKRKKMSEDIMFDKMDKLYDMLNIKKPPLSMEKDECDLFGELTAKRLQEMEQNQREYVMHEIENVMYKCDGKSATMSVLEYLQSKN